MRLLLVFGLALGLYLPGHASAPDYQAHFRAADRIVKSEGQPGRRDYQRASRQFDKGKQVPKALSELNYLGYDGSVAAAIRLCAIYADGIRNEVNPGAGLYWCGRANRAGYTPAGSIMQRLFDQYWPEIDDDNL
ncbi:MAG: hypothetical protein ACK4SX_00115 [Alcanivoracaceae bacterium]